MKLYLLKGKGASTLGLGSLEGRLLCRGATDEEELVVGLDRRQSLQG